MRIASLAALLLLFFSPLGQAKDISADFNCIELELFVVDKDHVGDRGEARATLIPPEMLSELRAFIASEIPLEIDGMKTRFAPEESCEDAEHSLTFGGRVTDFKKGSQVARYLIGFGAGKQKFEVNTTIKRKLDGGLIGEGRVVDRKAGGWIGGSKDKGKQDFAEKVADFIHSQLTGRKET